MIVNIGESSSFEVDPGDHTVEKGDIIIVMSVLVVKNVYDDEVDVDYVDRIVTGISTTELQERIAMNDAP